MGVIPCLIVYPLIFKPLLGKSMNARRISAASVLAVVIGLEAGAFGVVAETMASGISALPFAAFSALMLPIHLAIGIVEGLVTASVLTFVWRMRPEILEAANTGTQLSSVSIKKPALSLALIAVIVGGLVSLYASSNPDGLEWAIGKTAGEETEIAASGAVHDTAAAVVEETALLPDYAFASDPDNAAGTTVSGLAGSLATFALAGALGLILTRARRKAAAAAG